MAISQYLRSLRDRLGHELLLLPSVTAIVRDGNGRVLLIRQRSDGPWTLPGGIVDPGESPARALLREVWEETGLIVTPERVLAIFGGPEGFRRTYANGDEVEFVDTLFKCKVTGGAVGCRDDEVADVRFFEQNEAQTVAFAYPVPIERLLSLDESPYFKWDDTWFRTTCWEKA